mmetsp:Transcript_13026/g.14227  ORF Transcript_13026/g.14227 Transcript_13026/m.14227 type:complete len:134 (-) Transcript_13026:26-427(-)
MICLKEYTSVKSWPGLIAAGLSMLTGIVMLVTGPADTVVDCQEAFTADRRKSRQPTLHLHDTPMSSRGEEENSEVSTRTDPDASSSLRMSAPSAHSFVYLNLNRVHRRAARTRTNLATQVLAETPEKTPVTDN